MSQCSAVRPPSELHFSEALLRVLKLINISVNFGQIHSGSRLKVVLKLSLYKLKAHLGILDIKANISCYKSEKKKEIL